MAKVIITYLNRYATILFALTILKGCGHAPIKHATASVSSYPEVVNSSLLEYNLIKPDGGISEDLLAFLKLFGVQHEGTVQSVNTAMQQNFIRKAGQERWDLQDNSQDVVLRNQALALLKKMGLVNEIPHFQVDADYFLLFGATLSRSEQRFKDFVEQYTAGTLQCKNVILLGGVRKLQPSELDYIKDILGVSFINFLAKLGKKETDLTEADMLRFIWENEGPETLKSKFHESINLFFINSTDITQGTNQRPTTNSTIEAWLEECKPVPGKCHGNVEQPYGTRIEKNLRTCLEKYSRQLGVTSPKFSITWNSPAADDTLLLGVYKDELARNFYQEYNFKKSLHIIQE